MENWDLEKAKIELFFDMFFRGIIAAIVILLMCAYAIALLGAILNF